MFTIAAPSRMIASTVTSSKRHLAWSHPLVLVWEHAFLGSSQCLTWFLVTVCPYLKVMVGICLMSSACFLSALDVDDLIPFLVSPSMPESLLLDGPFLVQTPDTIHHCRAAKFCVRPTAPSSPFTQALFAHRLGLWQYWRTYAHCEVAMQKLLVHSRMLLC